MHHMNNRFGIIAENSSSRVSIFDTDTLKVRQQIPLLPDVIDVALTGDCRKAVVSSFSKK